MLASGKIRQSSQPVKDGFELAKLKSMKYRVSACALALLFLPLTFSSSHAATCYGDADCKACKTCVACGYCAKRGGTCGVCARAAANAGNSSNRFTGQGKRPGGDSQLQRSRAPQLVVMATFTGRVVGVSDGDTITVLNQKQPVKIRLWGIDAPEKAQAFGSVAKQYTSVACYGKTVTVYPQSVDRYGRTVAVVYVAKRGCLNYLLVNEGMAWHYSKYTSDEKLARYQAAAKSARRGLWRDQNPTPPWEFRRSKVH